MPFDQKLQLVRDLLKNVAWLRSIATAMEQLGSIEPDSQQQFSLIVSNYAKLLHVISTECLDSTLATSLSAVEKVFVQRIEEQDQVTTWNTCIDNLLKELSYFNFRRPTVSRQRLLFNAKEQLLQLKNNRELASQMHLELAGEGLIEKWQKLTQSERDELEVRLPENADPLFQILDFAGLLIRHNFDQSNAIESQPPVTESVTESTLVTESTDIPLLDASTDELSDDQTRQKRAKFRSLLRGDIVTALHSTHFPAADLQGEQDALDLQLNDASTVDNSSEVTMGHPEIEKMAAELPLAETKSEPIQHSPLAANSTSVSGDLYSALQLEQPGNKVGHPDTVESTDNNLPHAGCHALADYLSNPPLEEGVPTALEESQAEQLSEGLTTLLNSDYVNSLALKAIGEGRSGLAYHLLSCAKQCVSNVGLIAPEVASLDSLSAYATAILADMSTKIRSDCEAILLSTDPIKASPQVAILLATAGLLPAIAVVESDAASLLDMVDLPNDLVSVREIVGTILEYSKCRITVDPAVLTGINKRDDWNARTNAILDGLRNWEQSEPLINVAQIGATKAYRRWIQPNGVLGSIVRLVLQSPDHAGETVGAFVEKWSSDKTIEREFERTDGDQRNPHRNAISSAAMLALKKRVHNLIEKLREWKLHHDSRPDLLDNYQAEAIAKCRNKLHAAIPKAIDELEVWSQSSGPTSLDHVARAATRHLLRVQAAFTVGVTLPHFPEHADEILDADLIFVREPDAEQATNATSRLSQYAEAIELGMSIEEAFGMQLDQRQFKLAAIALARGWEGLESTQAKEQVELLRHRAEAGLLLLRTKLTELEHRIDNAICYDLLNETQREDFSRRISSTKGLIDHCKDRLHTLPRSLTSTSDALVLVSECPNLGREFCTFQEITDHLERLRQARLREVKSRFEELQKNSSKMLREDSRNYRLITETLENGDFPTADEYIGMAFRGEELTHEDEKDLIFEQYFLNFLPKVELSRRQNPGDKQQDWVSRVSQLTQEMSIKDESTVFDQELITQAFDLWRSIAKPNAESLHKSTVASQLLEFLGFDNVRVHFISQERTHWLCVVKCTKVENRRSCLIPQFGSVAAGRYVLVCIDRKCTDDDIEKVLSSVIKSRVEGDSPVIAVFLGPLNVARRKRLCELTWGRISFLLLDEYLLAFLASKTEGRLGAFFRCCLPFATAQPYTTTSSLVPFEMFFGRHRELEAIADQSETNLVYGGRQLGKSVLLREVERRTHNRSKGLIVRWLDLNNKGIGTHRKPEDLWQVIAQVLHEEEVFPRPVSARETIVGKIREWLAEKPQRRILLLLDEADRFLEQDSASEENAKYVAYPVVSQLKDLMDSTDRRFKVVFAGLHNVQRAAKDNNTPIAHLGKPINVGPLLEGGQARDARQLVERPLLQLGFRFENEHISTRILSHTNFYPSLIQVFCKHLVQTIHRHKLQIPDFRDCPPYLITMQEIEEVYQSDSLQKEIRDRFELTLKLDQRYRLIALLIAQNTLIRREIGEPLDGMDLRALRGQCLDVWSDGFKKDVSFEAFEILLEEMIGLGVLRQDDEERYMLRSANVLNLLGTQQHIEVMIEDVKSSSPPIDYKASAFRCPLKDGQFIERSPFTAEQEMLLAKRQNGVSVVIGCNLSGLNRVDEAFQLLSRNEETHPIFCPWALHDNAFQNWLEETSTQVSEGVSLLVIPCTSNWDDRWIEIAVANIQKKTATSKRFVRIVFIADPEKLWNANLGVNKPAGVEYVRLKTWTADFVTRWLLDNECNPDSYSGTLVCNESGGWSELIADFGKKLKQKPHEWRVILAACKSTWTSIIIEKSLLRLPDEAKKHLCRWQEWVGAERVDAETLRDLLGKAELDSLLPWAENLHLIQACEGGTWTLNPIIAQYLGEARDRIER